MPDDTQPSSFDVPEAFTALAKAMAAEAVSSPGSFKRAGAFREAVLKLRERWLAGEPPHTVRGSKATPPPAAPTPAPDYPTASEA